MSVQGILLVLTHFGTFVWNLSFTVTRPCLSMGMPSFWKDKTRCWMRLFYTKTTNQVTPHFVVVQLLNNKSNLTKTKTLILNTTMTTPQQRTNRLHKRINKAPCHTDKHSSTESTTHCRQTSNPKFEVYGLLPMETNNTSASSCYKANKQTKVSDE